MEHQNQHLQKSDLEQSTDTEEDNFFRIAEIDLEIARQEERMTQLQELFARGEITDHTKNPEMEAASYNIQELQAERARLTGDTDAAPKQSRLRRLGGYLFRKSTYRAE